MPSKDFVLLFQMFATLSILQGFNLIKKHSFLVIKFLPTVTAHTNSSVAMAPRHSPSAHTEEDCRQI